MVCHASAPHHFWPGHSKTPKGATCLPTAGALKATTRALTASAICQGDLNGITPHSSQLQDSSAPQAVAGPLTVGTWVVEVENTSFDVDV